MTTYCIYVEVSVQYVFVMDWNVPLCVCCSSVQYGLEEYAYLSIGILSVMYVFAPGRNMDWGHGYFNWICVSWIGSNNFYELIGKDNTNYWWGSEKLYRLIGGFNMQKIEV